jgi:hypothetical protein
MPTYLSGRWIRRDGNIYQPAAFKESPNARPTGAGPKGGGPDASEERRDHANDPGCLPSAKESTTS